MICDQVSNRSRSASSASSVSKPHSTSSLSRDDDAGTLQLENVDDAEVHAADGVGVVVDEPDAAGRPCPLDRDLLGELPPHAGVVGGVVAVLAVVAGDVAADAHRPLGPQPGLALAAAAGVGEVVRAVRRRPARRARSRESAA